MVSNLASGFVSVVRFQNLQGFLGLHFAFVNTSQPFQQLYSLSHGLFSMIFPSHSCVLGPWLRQEQADVLRRLSVSRSSIYGLKQRVFARRPRFIIRQKNY